MHHFSCIFLVVIFNFPISCQRYADFFYNVLYENTRTTTIEEPSPLEKQKRWKKGFAYVTKVVDGDTFWVDNGAEKIKVRFIGVDAPETRNTRYKEKGYYAIEAKEYVQKLTEHRWVRLEMDVQSHDRNKRLLAYIYLENGTFLNADLIVKGYAIVSTFPPNIKYSNKFVEFQRKAREKQRGLWAPEKS